MYPKKTHRKPLKVSAAVFAWMCSKSPTQIIQAKEQIELPKMDWKPDLFQNPAATTPIAMPIPQKAEKSPVTTPSRPNKLRRQKSFIYHYDSETGKYGPLPETFTSTNSAVLS